MRLLITRELIMNRPVGEKSYLLTIFILLVSSFGIFAELNEIALTGGPLYAEWSQADSSITCGLMVKAPSDGSKDRDPLQVLLVIDMSRSMEGAALQNAKSAAHTVLKSCADNDMFGIITFSDNAQTAFPLQPITGNNRQTAQSVISRLRYGGDRNLYSGIQSSVEQFKRFKSYRSSGRHMLLLTNGDPDRGKKNKNELISYIEKMADDYSFQISTFGYDFHFDENFLTACARKTRGRAYFIEEDSVSVMAGYFQKEMKKIADIAAQHVTLHIAVPEGTVMRNVYGGEVKDNTIAIGNVSPQSSHPVFFDLVKRPSRRRDIPVTIRYTEPIQQVSRKVRTYLDIPFTDENPVYNKEYAPMIMEFLTLRHLAETIDIINSSDKAVRRSYAESFQKKVKEFEHAAISIRSDRMKDVMERFKNIERDLENTAIESLLIIKRVKYQFLAFLYGD